MGVGWCIGEGLERRGDGVVGLGVVGDDFCGGGVVLKCWCSV